MRTTFSMPLIRLRFWINFLRMDWFLTTKEMVPVKVPPSVLKLRFFILTCILSEMISVISFSSPKLSIPVSLISDVNSSCEESIHLAAIMR